MSRNLSLAAVVVTHNRAAQLLQTVARLLAEDVDQVLIVDNASTDDTAAILARFDDRRLRILRLPDNRGGAGGFEAGLAAFHGPSCTLPPPDWTVLSDDDARPKPGAFTAFRKSAALLDPGSQAQGAVGVIAAAVELPHGPLCEMNRPARNPFWHLRVLGTVLLGLAKGRARQGFHLADAEMTEGAPPVDTDTASFVGFFVSRGAVARAGLPDGSLFIYGDDVIYSLQLRRHGFRIVLHPAVRFEHNCTSLGKGMATRPLWKVYYLCRNGVALARAAAGPLQPLALFWYCCVWASRARHYAPHERAIYWSMMWRGLRDGLLGRRGRNDLVHNPPTAASTPAARFRRKERSPL
jgi:GT2 family glycosyltransferase